MACSRRHKSPARCNGLPPDEGLGTKVTRSDAPEPDTPIGRTCLRGTQTRRPRRREHTRRRGETNGGDDGRSPMIENIPRARVPVGMVHHPAGTSRATGQAEASSCMTSQPDPRPVILWEQSRGSSPSCQRDACSGNRRRTRRRKEPHKLLRQVASGASSETSMRPNRREQSRPGAKLGFLTSIDFPTRCGRARRLWGPISPLVGENGRSKA